MYGRRLRFTFLWCASFCLCAVPVYSQILQEETLAGPDAHETAENTKGYLFGEWGGVRTRLLERGVKLDLHFISDALWNIKSQQNERFASYNRVRGTVDIDLGTLVHQQGWSFHATAVWQTGDNLGSYLGLVANPSSIASMNTFRLDSWWFQKSWLKNGSLFAWASSRVKIPTATKTSGSLSWLSRSAVHWTIYLIPLKPSILLPRRRWKSTLYRSTTST